MIPVAIPYLLLGVMALAAFAGSGEEGPAQIPPPGPMPGPPPGGPGTETYRGTTEPNPYMRPRETQRKNTAPSPRRRQAAPRGDVRPFPRKPRQLPGPVPKPPPSQPLANVFALTLEQAVESAQHRFKKQPSVIGIGLGNGEIIIYINPDSTDALMIPAKYMGWPVHFIDSSRPIAYKEEELEIPTFGIVSPYSQIVCEVVDELEETIGTGHFQIEEGLDLSGQHAQTRIGAPSPLMSRVQAAALRAMEHHPHIEEGKTSPGAVGEGSYVALIEVPSSEHVH